MDAESLEENNRAIVEKRRLCFGGIVQKGKTSPDTMLTPAPGIEDRVWHLGSLQVTDHAYNMFLEEGDLRMLPEISICWRIQTRENMFPRLLLP